MLIMFKYECYRIYNDISFSFPGNPTFDIAVEDQLLPYKDILLKYHLGRPNNRSALIEFQGDSIIIYEPDHKAYGIYCNVEASIK